MMLPIIFLNQKVLSRSSKLQIQLILKTSPLQLQAPGYQGLPWTMMAIMPILIQTPNYSQIWKMDHSKSMRSQFLLISLPIFHVKATLTRPSPLVMQTVLMMVMWVWALHFLMLKISPVLLLILKKQH